MPAQATVIALGASAFTGPVGYGIALVLAGAIDAYLIGSILAPDDIAEDLGKQNLNIRTASGTHKIIYGRTMTGGVVVFLDVLDRYYLDLIDTDCPPTLREKRTAGKYLNMAIALAAHEIDGVESIWIGEDLVFQTDTLTGAMELVKSKYNGYVSFEIYNGNQTNHSTFIKANVDKHYDGGSASNATNLSYYTPQGVIAATSNTLNIDTNRTFIEHQDLDYDERIWTGGKGGGWSVCAGTFGAPGGAIVNWTRYTGSGRAVPAQGKPWTSNYKLTNTAYAYFRFRYNPDLYKGVPKVRVVLRGKKVYDPRWDEQYLTISDEGSWTGGATYAVGDKVTNPDSKAYICQVAHTATSGSWSNSTFQTDFIENQYWKLSSIVDDPSTWEWTDNWALCLRDYLTSGNYYAVLDNTGYTRAVSLYGIGVKQSEIDELNIVEAANVSDERVYLEGASKTVSTESWSSSNQRQTITVVGDITEYYAKYEHLQLTTSLGTIGDLIYNGVIAIKFSGATSVDLDNIVYQVSSQDYSIEEVYYTVGTNKTTIKFKTAKDLNPTAIRLWSSRFTINGIVDTGNSPIGILENMLASGAGKLPYAQGKFLLIPGIYITPTISINESNLAGPISVQGSLPSSELINVVTGTIKNPAANWEETDFARQTSQTYIDADGGYELTQNVKYPFTTSNFDAQRLARISLQRSREQVSCTMLCNLSVMEILIGAFINVSIERLGWTNKVFSVTSWSFQEGKIQLGLREENTVAYDWVDTQLTPITYRPDTDFEVAPTLLPITDFALSSGTAELIALADGTIVPRVKFSWTAPEQDLQTYLSITYSIKPFDIDDNVVSTQEVRIREVDEEEWWIDEVKEGDVLTATAVVVYDDPSIPNESTKAIVTTHTVLGKSVVPIDVTGFTYDINEDLLVLSWNPINEIDLSHYEIQVGGTAWDTGTTYVDTTTSTEYIVTGVDVSSDTYRLKAVDTSGNKSTNAVTVAPNIMAPSAIADVIYTIQESTILLSWGAAPAGTFPVFAYEVRYGSDPTFLDNTLVAIVNSTEYNITDTFAGSRTYRIAPKDIYGNYGPQTTEVVSIVIPSAPSISSYILNGDKVEFTWSSVIDPQTQIPVESYEIAHGTDPVWANNTFILTTGTDGFSRRVDWLNSVEPTRTFRVRAIDHQGTPGTVATVQVTITDPGAFVVNSQVIDNNILLTWNEPTITPNAHLPILHYEVNRGDVYGTSEIIGHISGLFSAIFETVAGTFTYWVTAHDTAENEGPHNSVTAAVNQPPDYSLLVNASDDFVTVDTYWLSHVLNNAFVASNGNLVIPVNLTETWTQHFVNNTWNDIQDQIDASFPIYIQPTPASGDYTVVYDIGTDVDNLAVTLNLTSQIVAGDPVTTSTIYTALFNVTPTGTNDTLDATGVTLHDTGGSFLTEASIGSTVTNTTTNDVGVITSVTDDTHVVMLGGLTGGGDNEWGAGDGYSINNWINRGSTTTNSITAFVPAFRYVKVFLDVASSANDTDVYELSALNIVIDVKEKTDSGKAVTNGSGFAAVDFTKTFIDVTSIVLTPNVTGGGNVVAVYDFLDAPNPTDFDVYTFDGADGSVEPDIDFSWVARGY